MRIGQDPWDSGDPYELFMGRWSRVIAPKFIDWLSLPPDRSWLDIGCGTGSLSKTILALASPAQILALDPSIRFIDTARRTIDDARIHFEVGTATRLPAPTNTFDVVVSGLVLNFVPDPLQAVYEMRRASRRGGVIAAFVWDYTQGMEMLRYFWDTAVALDQRAKELDEGWRFPICQPDRLEHLFIQAGLREVVIQAIDIRTVFKDFDDYWLPFMGGQGPAPGYVAGLGSEGRVELEKALRERLPISEDGSIELRARAWGVKGMN
jgi:SAM-dependent methyltransferase